MSMKNYHSGINESHFMLNRACVQVTAGVTYVCGLTVWARYLGIGVRYEAGICDQHQLNDVRFAVD